MSVKIGPEEERRSKKDPVRPSKLRQTSQVAFAASSFSSWLNLHGFEGSYGHLTKKIGNQEICQFEPIL